MKLGKEKINLNIRSIFLKTKAIKLWKVSKRSDGKHLNPDLEKSISNHRIYNDMALIWRRCGYTSRSSFCDICYCVKCVDLSHTELKTCHKQKYLWYNDTTVYEAFIPEALFIYRSQLFAYKIPLTKKNKNIFKINKYQ